VSNVLRFARKHGPSLPSGSRPLIRSAQAVWRGDGSTGCGAICVESAEPAERPYSLMGRLASGNGTNPAELLAAAHASCFTMYLAFSLQSVGYPPAELSTEAVVTLEPDGASMRMSRSALTLRARVPNIDRGTFEAIAWHAEQTCPISKALRAQITLNAKLI
jgi:lipoyl-dependent peroxiredoxin